MQIYKGKSVFGGIAIGKISVYKKDEQLVKRVKIEDADAEMERYTTARNIAAAQLQKLYDKALKEVGEANAAIFEVHQMMLEDEDYNESVENIIHSQMVNAEYAVAPQQIILPRCLRPWTMIICAAVRQMSEIFQNV